MEEEKTELNFFEKLKAIRKDKGVSLEYISEKYRVQLKYLRALEEGDLLAIPEVYDKLFFRSYLKALGLEEDDYYDDFIDYRRKVRLDKTTTVFDFDQKEAEKKLINTRNVMVALPFLVVILVIWILINNTEMIKSNTENPVNVIDIQDVVREMQAETRVASDSLEEFTNKSDTLHLGLVGLKRTWFRLVIDQTDTSEYLFQKGNSMNFQAVKSYEFLIGRADGLKFYLNGKNLPALGNDSSVVRYLKIDSTGIAASVVSQSGD